MKHKDKSFRNIMVSDVIEDDTVEMIPLLSPEEEEEIDKYKIPDELPILPVKNTVLFPDLVIPITVSRQKAIRLVKKAYKGNRIIGVVAQANPLKEDPAFEDLYKVGTVAHILKTLVLPDGNTTIIIQGKRRFQMTEVLQEDPYLIAKASLMPENFPEAGKREIKALVRSL